MHVSLCSYFLYRDVFIVPVVNGLTSFYAGLATFSIVGFVAREKGMSVDTVFRQGRITCSYKHKVFIGPQNATFITFDLCIKAYVYIHVIFTAASEFVFPIIK